jgi:tetratricopeptide (TPR) repeat protein
MSDADAEGLVVEAIAVLEAEPPSRELVAAYAELAGTYWMGGRLTDAIATAEDALRLAAELGLPEPAHAHGYRGGARAYLGYRAGIEDMRRALALALEQGRSREAAVIHNNLALSMWMYDGPGGALDACREGIDFCERRGITDHLLGIATMRQTFLACAGQAEQVLVESVPLATRLEATGSGDVLELRSVLLRLRARQGEHAGAEDDAHSLVSMARASGEPPIMVMAAAAAVECLVPLGRPDAAAALLDEVGGLADSRDDTYYLASLPGLVRAALALGSAALASRLVDGVESGTPLAEHALRACHAALAEGAGDHTGAATLFADAAERWRAFGDVPETAYALLGQGRCLRALGHPAADAPLLEARELFASMGFAPALAEVDDLLGHSGEVAVAEP